MRIGLWINDNYNPNRGGGFSYADKLIKAMDTYSFSGDFELCFISLAENAPQCLKHEYQYVGVIPRFLKKLPLIGRWIQELDKRVLFPHFGIPNSTRIL